MRQFRCAVKFYDEAFLLETMARDTTAYTLVKGLSVHEKLQSCPGTAEVPFKVMKILWLTITLIKTNLSTRILSNFGDDEQYLGPVSQLIMVVAVVLVFVETSREAICWLSNIAQTGGPDRTWPLHGDIDFLLDWASSILHLQSLNAWNYAKVRRMKPTMSSASLEKLKAYYTIPRSHLRSQRIEQTAWVVIADLPAMAY